MAADADEFLMFSIFDFSIPSYVDATAIVIHLSKFHVQFVALTISVLSLRLVHLSRCFLIFHHPHCLRSRLFPRFRLRKNLNIFIFRRPDLDMLSGSKVWLLRDC